MQRLATPTAHVNPIATPVEPLSPAGTVMPQPALPRANVEQAPARSGAGLAPHRLQRVIACIEARLAEHVQVRELADEIHMSPFHFARMFKLATGHAPHAYITRRRMERAKELLASTQLPLLEVAARVGYQTQAHFTGVFHRYVGTTPRVYRLQQRGGSAAAAE